MWIDTAGTLPAKSQLTVAASARLSCLVPIDSCSQSRPTNNWSRSASPFKTPPRSQIWLLSVVCGSWTYELYFYAEARSSPCKKRTLQSRRTLKILRAAWLNIVIRESGCS
ncbi:hypothetical protein BASA50_001239 [Batrachochytrium salamandrivorans]|uniref:Uncharacterized protein n=1 Tax=Batrachochytrium salamandrivorans TaxID=1357716 RepID=A0ABQ8ET19_9FUNG|nr:hypothetical protein BASA50_001239 [Batrachochytrium salamandrivorans]